MRVLLINPNCTTGGIETFMHALAASLSSMNVEVACFFFSDGGQFDTFAGKYASYLGSQTSLSQLLARHRYDVIHANASAVSVGLLDELRRAEWNGRLVVTSHDWVHPGWNSGNCFAYVAVNRELAREIEGYTDLAVDVIYNGIDTDRFSPPLSESVGPPIVAWVGRGGDLPQKRIDKLAAVAPMLREAGVRLWIADPDGPDQVERESACMLQGCAEFWGRVPFSEMPAFYREVAASGGCLLSTSSFEGHSVALLEAQACGCPVIAPDVRGIREGVSPAHGGVLYPFELHASAVARLVITSLANAEVMQQRRRACRAYVAAQFSFERMACDYLDLYRRPEQRRQPDSALPGERRERARRLVRLASDVYSTDIRRACLALQAAMESDPSLQWNPLIQTQRLWFWAKRRRYLAWAARHYAQTPSAHRVEVCHCSAP